MLQNILDIVWNHLGLRNAPFTARFMELILKFYRCKDAPFGASYWAKIKFNLNRNILNLKRWWNNITFEMAILTLS